MSADGSKCPSPANWRRWLETAVAVLGLALAATLVAGLALAVLSSPAAKPVLERLLPIVFFVFGIASAATQFARHRHRCDRASRRRP